MSTSLAYLRAGSRSVVTKQAAGPPAIGSPEQISNMQRLRDTSDALGLAPGSNYKPGYTYGTRPAEIGPGVYPGFSERASQTPVGAGNIGAWPSNPQIVPSNGGAAGMAVRPTIPKPAAMPKVAPTLGGMAKGANTTKVTSYRMNPLADGACSVVSKQAATVPTRPTSIDLGLDMDSTGGRFADYLGLPWGHTRAGRASHLADATGYPYIDNNVRRPLTSDVLNTLIGGGLGAVGGGLLGAGMGAAGNAHNVGDVAGVGAAVGGVGGGLLGLLGGRGERRQSMKDIANDYDSGAQADATLRPQGANVGIGSFFTPLGGPHRAGQVDVYEALNRQAGGADGGTVSNGIGRNALYSLLTAGRTSPVGLPLSFAAGVGQSLNAGARADKVDRQKRLQARKSERDTANTTKAANDWMNTLADGAKSVVSKVDLKNPLHTGAIGAGVGAVGGLAGSMLSEEQSKNKLRNMMLGGLAGGGIGAGAGMLNQPSAQDAGRAAERTARNAKAEALRQARLISKPSGGMSPNQNPQDNAAAIAQLLGTAAAGPTLTPLIRGGAALADGLDTYNTAAANHGM